MGAQTAARPGSTGFSPVTQVASLEYILRVGQTPPSKSIPEHFRFLRPAAATLPCGARVSNCGARASEAAAPGPRAQAQASTSTGLAAPRHVGSSWPRDGACGPCIGRRILSHCTTREAQTCHLEGFLCGNQSSFSRFLLRKGVQSWLSLATQPLRARSVASHKAAGALAPRSPGANKSRVVWGPGKVTDCKEAGLPALRM